MLILCGCVTAGVQFADYELEAAQESYEMMEIFNQIEDDDVIVVTHGTSMARERMVAVYIPDKTVYLVSDSSYSFYSIAKDAFPNLTAEETDVIKDALDGGRTVYLFTDTGDINTAYSSMWDDSVQCDYLGTYIVEYSNGDYPGSTNGSRNSAFYKITPN